ncbi:MAG: hypothetical protein QOI13_390 [Paraburkholderia sp.]|nr:hypothetical protein [Paraburkholderia sp.]
MRRPNPDDFVKEIASATRTPPDVVERMYAQTLEAFTKDARITDYVPILVAKRVRELLRHPERNAR